MLSISAKIRKEVGRKTRILRKKGILPAVLYGPKIKNLVLEVDSKEFEKVFKEAGESSLVTLEVEGEKKKFMVLIHEVSRDPLSSDPLHVDFYQPVLDKEIEVDVPIVFEGEAPAVKSLSGTLVKSISEVEVRALPQNLPKEIKVNVDSLKMFEDNICIKDLKIGKDIKISRNPEDIIAHVVPPARVEEELEKPIEEKVEDVEKIEKKKKEEEPEEKKEEAAEKKKQEPKKEK